MLPNAPVLLSMHTIPTVAGNIISFFDDGSDCSLILNSAAERLGLHGEAVSMEVTTITGVVHTNSHLYTISILDRENNPREIKAFGMNQLNGKVRQIEVNGVKNLISASKQQDQLDLFKKSNC